MTSPAGKSVLLHPPGVEGRMPMAAPATQTPVADLVRTPVPDEARIDIRILPRRMSVLDVPVIVPKVHAHRRVEHRRIEELTEEEIGRLPWIGPELSYPGANVTAIHKSRLRDLQQKVAGDRARQKEEKQGEVKNPLERFGSWIIELVNPKE